MQDAKERSRNLQDVLRNEKELKKNARSAEEKEDIDKNIYRTQSSIREVEGEVNNLTQERGRLEVKQREMQRSK